MVPLLPRYAGFAPTPNVRDRRLSHFRTRLHWQVTGPPSSEATSDQLLTQRPSLHGTSFTSVKQLREHIDAFIKAYNTNATPFAWTRSKVHQKRLKPRFAHQ